MAIIAGPFVADVGTLMNAAIDRFAQTPSQWNTTPHLTIRDSAPQGQLLLMVALQEGQGPGWHRSMHLWTQPSVIIVFFRPRKLISQLVGFTCFKLPAAHLPTRMWHVALVAVPLGVPHFTAKTAWHPGHRHPPVSAIYKTIKIKMNHLKVLF